MFRVASLRTLVLAFLASAVFSTCLAVAQDNSAQPNTSAQPNQDAKPADKQPADTASEAQPAQAPTDAVDPLKRPINA